MTLFPLTRAGINFTRVYRIGQFQVENCNTTPLGSQDTNYSLPLSITILSLNAIAY